MMTAVTAGEPLNILHTIDLNKLYPIVRCQLTLDQALDLPKLYQALKTIGQVIPEIYAGYDLENNQWLIPDTRPQRLVQQVASEVNIDALTLDLETGPQLHVYLQDTKTGHQVTFVMSHILTDGAGFKQFLYLLAAIYNQGSTAIQGLKNHMDVTGLETLVQQQKVGTLKPTDHPSAPLYLPTLNSQATTRQYYVNDCHLSKTDSQKLKTWAKVQGVTLNDIFMAVFGQLMQSYAAVPEITLACPTDTRQYLPEKERQQLRIQNATARYNTAVTNDFTQPLTATIQAFHQQMTMLKQDQQFLQSIRQLLTLAKTQPISALREVVQQNYSVRPIAYTNFGIIDASRLNFTGCTIKHCLLTGSFREAPAFQAAFSSFNHEIIIGFNMIGTTEEINFGNALLQQLKQNLQLVTTL
ncbi:condensation domain-containing protein [Agrilactobacillus yilanensis]|uniref:Condensation domain-containing protein n=2 Tax=Agrilactobacillus yilanensis TaxID=2485997 RepID=A0ABW4J575_9LACO